MKTFKVTIKQTRVFDITQKAESEKEAKLKVLETFSYMQGLSPHSTYEATSAIECL